MTCAACSARVEKVTKAVADVETAEVNLLGGSMVVEAKTEAAAQAIIAAVQNAGYGASLAGEKKTEASEKPDQSLKEMKIRIIGSAVSLLS